MKLIDKEKLNEELIGLIPFGVTEVLAKTLKGIIDHRTVIEAIPVEWIEKKIEELKDTDDYLGDVSISVHEFYEHVLEIWRKEND